MVGLIIHVRREGGVRIYGKGEYSDTRADPTDRHRSNRTLFVIDQLSRSQWSDGESHSNASVVLPLELQLQTKLVTEPTDMAIFCFVL